MTLVSYKGTVSISSECHKRPTTVSKETYYSVVSYKGTVSISSECHKRPTTVSKETYYSVVSYKGTVSINVLGCHDLLIAGRRKRA